MADQLKGKRVAALATHGFEQDELLQPRNALIDAGAAVDVVSPESGKIRGWKHKEWGEDVKVDRTLEQARSDEYDALLLPGGVMRGSCGGTLLPPRLRGTASEMVVFHRHRVLKSGASSIACTRMSRVVAGCRYRNTSDSGNECCGPSDNSSASSVAAACSSKLN